MKLLAVFCLMTFSYVSGEQRAVFLCGRQLANARAVLCYGSEYIAKRGNDNAVLDNIVEDDMFYAWPWSGRRGALSADWSRYKRDEPGLVDQCCLRPCTKDVILNYC